MTDEKRFESLMKLAEFRMGIREARRSFEWRVSLTLWIGMGAGLVSLRGIPYAALASALLFVVVCYSWLWIRWNWFKSERDARLAYFYAETAEALLLADAPEADRNPLTRPEELFGFLRHGPPVFQILATVLLAAGLVFSAGRPEKPATSNCAGLPSPKQEKTPNSAGL